MEKAIQQMPAELFKTLTWDRGKEMARHKEIKVATGVQVYFCDPHAPWQHGLDETPTDCSVISCRRAPICQCTSTRRTLTTSPS